MAIRTFTVITKDGKELICPAPLPAAYKAKRELNRDAEFRDLEKQAESDDDARVFMNIILNSAHAIESLRFTKAKGVKLPNVLTLDTCYAFAFENKLLVNLDADESDSADAEENPTGTTVASS